MKEKAKKKEERKKSEEKLLENKVRMEFNERRAKLAKEKIQNGIKEKKMKSLKLFRQNLNQDVEKEKKHFELIIKQRNNGVNITNNNLRTKIEKEREEYEKKFEEDEKISEMLLRLEEKLKNSEDMKKEELSKISLNARDMTLSSINEQFKKKLKKFNLTITKVQKKKIIF